MIRILSEYFSDDGKKTSKVTLTEGSIKLYHLHRSDGQNTDVMVCNSQEEAEDLAEDWVL
jgi:K+/H+ antiporter YhaU regulatory subunit KhtT